MTISYAIFTGFLAAAAHVFSGPDHLAAVAPFAVNSATKSWRIGLFWGMGHLSGMLVIGLLFTLLQDLPPLELISSYSESLVGLVLIGVGAWAVYKAYFQGSGVTKPHPHHHQQQKDHLASFSIGSLHGLAGVAHFILFLPVIGFDNRASAVFYILGFALGTVVTMIFFTFILGRLKFIGNSDKKKNFVKNLQVITGVAAIAVGIYWILIN